MNQLGLDIGGTSIKAALFKNGRCRRTTQSGLYANPTINDLRAAIRAVTEDTGNLDSVGLCLPGLFDQKSQRITQSVNVPALVGLPIGKMIRDTLRLPRRAPVHIHNDALAAAHDIQASRRVTGRLLVVALGTGVGCAVLDGPTPLDVDGGSPGHLGQIDVSIPGHHIIGPDGGAGGLEGYIGTPALLKRHRGRSPDKTLPRYIGVEPPILALARALRIAHAIYRPQHICLCGGIGLALQHLLPAIRKRVKKNLTSVARPNWTLTCADDLFHAARGAARLAES